MRKKQFYEKPAMKVVKLQQQPQLLAGSTVDATMNTEWTEETI